MLRDEVHGETMAMTKPFSDACERNKQPILDVLRTAFADRRQVLELGAGTGQHAVHFARHLPHLVWQTSDVAQHLPGIQQWIDEAALPNLPAAIGLDINQASWPSIGADAVFTANTLHIISWPEVQRLFERVGALLPAQGVLVVYGPFKYRGMHTAESNARFDIMLRERDPDSGLRDFEAVEELARHNGFALMQDQAMPANNRTVVWGKSQ
jgi:cyclopropane fatty-acyl-phospholipid synthase-like methyltransferase